VNDGGSSTIKSDNEIGSRLRNRLIVLVSDCCGTRITIALSKFHHTSDMILLCNECALETIRCLSLEEKDPSVTMA